MTPFLVALVVGGYFLVLIIISWWTSRSATSETFYTANRSSPWYLVAFGMIGATLSGVTFISVPGEVGNSNFHYFQMVLGYILGYAVIALVLLPLYYKHNLVSIYQYLLTRFGKRAHKTGAFFFLISRVIGASFRLFLVAGVLQIAFFDAFGLPFWVSVATAILLIWVYTWKGGIKTIVWTDTLQTFFMLFSVGFSIYLIKSEMGFSFGELFSSLQSDPKTTAFDWRWQPGTNFFKQFISGAFIAIVMTGLDQDMMQKNLTCRSLKDAQKNVFWFTGVLVIVKVLFLVLGVMLYQYADFQSIVLPERTDSLFPVIAIQHFPLAGAVLFLLGITAAAYSSADSALTALTTSFCVDFLGFEPKNFGEQQKTRIAVHLGFSLLLFLVVIVFNVINDRSVISAVFTVAGYTYGPLLGLFTFGIFTRIAVKDKMIPLVCVLSPILSFVLQSNSATWFGGYTIGFEILLFNGFFTFMGLWLLRKR